MNNEQIKEYESPEIFELGEADTLTHGHWGDASDGIGGKWVFAP